MSIKHCSAIASCIVAAVFVSGCQTTNPYSNESQNAKATNGALIGALAGAAIGVASSSKSDRGKGALIGAASGAALGGGIGYYMDQQEAELRHKLKGSGVQVARSGDEITLIMPGNITFDTGKSNIKGNFTEVLGSVALVLKEFDETAIKVEGHTDSTGSLSLNQTLSEQRANSVKYFLQTKQIASGRIHASGLGPRYPIASNSSAAGREANRRVELKLLPLK